jgi:MFS family permease
LLLGLLKNSVDRSGEPEESVSVSSGAKVVSALVARSALTRIFFACILAHSAVTGSRVAVSLTGLSVNASPFTIGMMLSLYSLLPMFVLVSAGRWVDQIGVRKPIVWSMVLATFGIALPFLMFDMGSLFLAPVCIGLGFMTVLLCIQRIAGIAKSSQERKSNFSQMALAFSISGFIGPTMSGLLIDSVGHRYTFAVLGLFMLAAMYFFWTQIYPDVTALGADSEPDAKDTSTNLESASLVASTLEPTNAVTRKPILQLLKDPELLRLYICVTLICAAWDIHQFLVPIYGAQQGLSASKIGLVLGTFSLATFIVRLILPYASQYVREWPLILGAMAVALVVYLAYPWASNLSQMLALAFMLGLGLGVAQPMVMSVMYRAAPADRIGEATGLRLTLVNASQTFLPMMGGAFGTLGFASVFWALAVLMGGGIGFVFWSRQKHYKN